MPAAKVPVHFTTTTANMPGGTPEVAFYQGVLRDPTTGALVQQQNVTPAVPAVDVTFTNVPAGTYTAQGYSIQTNGQRIGDIQEKSVAVTDDVQRIVSAP